MDTGSFFRDYETPFATTIAVLTTIINVIFGQYFKDRQGARAILVGTSAVFGIIAVFGAFYSQYQLVSSTNAERAQAAGQIQTRLAIKNLLGNAINDGEALAAKPVFEGEFQSDLALVQTAGSGPL
jgi:hypothetical protein